MSAVDRGSLLQNIWLYCLIQRLRNCASFLVIYDKKNYALEIITQSRKLFLCRHSNYSCMYVGMCSVICECKPRTKPSWRCHKQIFDNWQILTCIITKQAISANESAHFLKLCKMSMRSRKNQSICLFRALRATCDCQMLISHLLWRQLCRNCRAMLQVARWRAEELSTYRQNVSWWGSSSVKKGSYCWQLIWFVCVSLCLNALRALTLHEVDRIQTYIPA